MCWGVSSLCVGLWWPVLLCDVFCLVMISVCVCFCHVWPCRVACACHVVVSGGLPGCFLWLWPWFCMCEFVSLVSLPACVPVLTVFAHFLLVLLQISICRCVQVNLLVFEDAVVSCLSLVCPVFVLCPVFPLRQVISRAECSVCVLTRAEHSVRRVPCFWRENRPLGFWASHNTL